MMELIVHADTGYFIVNTKHARQVKLSNLLD